MTVDPKKTAERLKKATSMRPSLAIVLGSGFQEVLSGLQVETSIPYAKLPGIPQVGVAGHAGKLLIGRLGGVPVLVLSGRSHYYEGRSMAEVTFAMRVVAAFGVRAVLLTNAAGGIHWRHRQGDFMLITDHINLMGENPLRGVTGPGSNRFVDLTQVYDPDLQALLRQAAREANVPLREGVYLAVSGPTYETPAEVRAFARLGADAVGMSTVPEAVVARQHGLAVVALSCITNRAAGLAKEPLSHLYVLAQPERVRQNAARLLTAFARLYGERPIDQGAGRRAVASHLSP
jgi:purine-nucleoside phosphorylase